MSTLFKCKGKENSECGVSVCSAEHADSGPKKSYFEMISSFRSTHTHIVSVRPQCSSCRQFCSNIFSSSQIDLLRFERRCWFIHSLVIHSTPLKKAAAAANSITRTRILFFTKQRIARIVNIESSWIVLLLLLLVRVFDWQTQPRKSNSQNTHRKSLCAVAAAVADAIIWQYFRYFFPPGPSIFLGCVLLTLKSGNDSSFFRSSLLLTSSKKLAATKPDW